MIDHLSRVHNKLSWCKNNTHGWPGDSSCARSSKNEFFVWEIAKNSLVRVSLFFASPVLFGGGEGGGRGHGGLGGNGGTAVAVQNFGLRVAHVVLGEQRVVRHGLVQLEVPAAVDFAHPPWMRHLEQCQQILPTQGIRGLI